MRVDDRPGTGSPQQPDEDSRSGGLGRYLKIARSHWVLMTAIVLVAVAGAVAFWQIEGETYTAESLIIVSPVARDDDLYDGLPVLREASAPTRDVETVARLIDTEQVAQEAKSILDSERSPQELLKDIEASPIAQSFLVAVRADAGTPEGAASLANAFARGTVAVRNRQFQAQAERITAALEAQVDAGTATAQTRQRLSGLEALGGADPTVQVETAATVPTEPSSPGLPLVIGAAFFIGLVFAFVAALAVEATSVRVRSEGQLTERFRIPVLAGIPKQSASAGSDPMSAAALESYRTLRQNLSVMHGPGHETHSVLFTSGTYGEGRTTVAVNTARSLARAGYRVVLVDADGRRAGVSRFLPEADSPGLIAVASGEEPLERALVSAGDYSGSLEVLAHGPRLTGEGDLSLSQDKVGRLIASAGRRADFVIFDAPPLGEVADALPIAAAVDDVLIMVQRGRTRLSDLRTLIDVLHRYDISARGFVLIGGRSRHREDRGARAQSGPAAMAPVPPGRTPLDARDRAEPAEPSAGATRTT